MHGSFRSYCAIIDIASIARTTDGLRSMDDVRDADAARAPRRLAMPHPPCLDRPRVDLPGPAAPAAHMHARTAELNARPPIPASSAYPHKPCAID